MSAFDNGFDNLDPDDMVAGPSSEGPRRVSMLDVAELAGVSASTVSRFFNGQPIRQRDAVEKAIEQLNFVPSHSARTLKLGHSRSVAVVGPDTTNPYFAYIVNGAESVAREHGYGVMLVSVDMNSSSDDEERTLSQLAGRVDGVIITPLSEHSRISERFRALGLPCVLLENDSSPIEENDRVLIDHHQSGYAAASYLIELGHTRIGTIYPRLNTTAGRLKREGIRAALTDAGLLMPAAFEAGGSYGRQAGFNAMMDLAMGQVRPTAVISCASLLTIGALRAIRELSIRIPDDLSLIAIDDYEMFDLVSPPISVIDRPMSEQGATAMRLLLSGLNGEQTVARSFALKTRLIVRGSCAPLR